jgi:small GTP-binding protein
MQAMQALPIQRKVVLLGDAHVGKTQLLNAWIGRPFATTRTAPTIAGAATTITSEIDDLTYRFQFWDTAGAERVFFLQF